MLSSSFTDELLVDESQLGQRLNESLQKSDRADFVLLLSLLSTDVTDAPRLEGQDFTSRPPTDEQLRAALGLGPAVKSYASADDLARSADISRLFHQEGQHAVFLELCLNPQALTPAEHYLAPEVLANISLLKREKVLREIEGEREAGLRKVTKADLSVLEEIGSARALA